MGATHTKSSVLPISRRVIHMPSDYCPNCGIPFLEPEYKVTLLATGLLRKASWTVYRCECGYVWRQYWPGVGLLIRKALAVKRQR